ncbi:hypothetical protein NL676_018140 [Syzygium grande]|nr:hypothetical protein NL676_018140 [Syzygium grande]
MSSEAGPSPHGALLQIRRWGGQDTSHTTTTTPMIDHDATSAPRHSETKRLPHPPRNFFFFAAAAAAAAVSGTPFELSRALGNLVEDRNRPGGVSRL